MTSTISARHLSDIEKLFYDAGCLKHNSFSLWTTFEDLFCSILVWILSVPALKVYSNMCCSLISLIIG